MTGTALVIPEDAAAKAADYLNAPHERMAFHLADRDEAGARWTVTDTLLLDDERDYDYQGPFGMELADHVRSEVLKWASAFPDRALVEVHAHGAGRSGTTFSPTDLEGLAEVVPHMLWRRRGTPYMAVVHGPHDLDALIFTERKAPPTCPASVLIGGRALTPTGLGYRRFIPRET